MSKEIDFPTLVDHHNRVGYDPRSDKRDWLNRYLDYRFPDPSREGRDWRHKFRDLAETTFKLVNASFNNLDRTSSARPHSDQEIAALRDEIDGWTRRLNDFVGKNALYRNVSDAMITDFAAMMEDSRTFDQDERAHYQAGLAGRAGEIVVAEVEPFIHSRDRDGLNHEYFQQ